MNLETKKQANTPKSLPSEDFYIFSTTLTVYYLSSIWSIKNSSRHFNYKVSF